VAISDATSRRLHPRLRCLKNGAAPVNLLRSNISATVATAPSVSAEALGLPANLDLSMFRESLPASPTNVLAGKPRRLPKRKKLADQPQPERSYVRTLSRSQRR
jgi:hypothetical protein